jgi:tRNA uridine 5-carboxymethylaminomethyl modification enzyme
MLARGDCTYAQLRARGVDGVLSDAWGEALEVRVRYRGYLERQQRAADRQRALEEAPLPESLWAGPLTGVSREASEKLRRTRPARVGQAGRIAGVSPADVAVLIVLAQRARSEGARAPGSVADLVRDPLTTKPIA